ncbi:MAG TPA: Ig-like domain-containing protein [Acidobacteriaceae bacterium]
MIGCGNPSGLDSVQVTPASQSLTVGQTAQLTAVGTYGNASHPTTQNITNTVTWSSSTPAVATVSATGLVTAVEAGTTIITANSEAFNGPASSTADLTVTASTGGTAGGSGGSILSLTIIPSGIVFGSLMDSGQFLAIGTFSTAPTVRDLTNSVTWLTSEPNKFPVTNYSIAAPGGGTQNGGVVSDYEASTGNVGAIITAEATDSNGSIATATAGVGCPLVLPNPPQTPGSCYQNVPQLLTTLTVYNEGLNTTNWLVTAPSATNTPNVIYCGPAAGTGKSVCTATYPLGTTVTLTAPAIQPGATGPKFGGWSSNCYNTAPITESGPNHCTVNLLTSDATVGAIFN